jgi:serine/threonine protein kinase
LTDLTETSVFLNQPMKDRTILEIFSQALLGLHYIHSKRLTHGAITMDSIYYCQRQNMVTINGVGFKDLFPSSSKKTKATSTLLIKDSEEALGYTKFELTPQQHDLHNLALLLLEIWET